MVRDARPRDRARRLARFRPLLRAASLISNRPRAARIVPPSRAVPPLRYLQQFEWDHAKYPFRRPLPELVSLIQSVSARRSAAPLSPFFSARERREAPRARREVRALTRPGARAGSSQGVSSIEDELKHLSISFAEKMQAQQSLKRKKGYAPRATRARAS